MKKEKAPVPLEELKNAGRSMAELCLGVAAATHVACMAGPEVRPAAGPPPPQACPRGYFEALKPLGTFIGDSFGSAAFTVETADKRKPIPVKEGDATLMNLRPWGNMPRDTKFVGHLYFGKDRIYGRFTEARVPGLGTFPICMELEQELKRGAEMEAGSTPDRVLIFPLLDLRVVERFE